ncbi:CMP/dCMP deaminase zinc-binding [Ruminiclostridium papyrosolvens DSM 2782]|uniref:tRNA-specific adenosine deaminase n=1 Tax=Ruminiclostridium papyrosolvens DSM 2782 TaxID=588581 RepID=F1TFD2_9FIRM|nr:tRNA adenosine(34) deaminase TadA [Ruminiclostridium papyrosolvens]EGD46856.1 CMP/dCMP deaminase zinc-binding [Ruminiclostridium papyrosolvens DSM 2782]WES34341.1 tRNA adenosine(34) deaminase TadA [Ruminiclostridium papyrosolvens DSM 2782]
MYTRNEQFMQEAIKQAKEAYAKGESPVGAIVVKDGELIASGCNQKEEKQDVTSHAEIEALKKAAKKLGTWRLDGCDMYVTLEPCAMCAGAIIQSRIKTLYIGAMDKKAGAAGSVIDLFRVPQFNHRVDVVYGLMFEECGNILTEFFKRLRK